MRCIRVAGEEDHAVEEVDCLCTLPPLGQGCVTSQMSDTPKRGAPFCTTFRQEFKSLRFSGSCVSHWLAFAASQREKNVVSVLRDWWNYHLTPLDQDLLQF